MNDLPPWSIGPFELIVHAETHLRSGEDFDRRIALISFDNAIEIAITTYLTLNPIQRGNRQYKKDNVENWLQNYHTKLGFLESELIQRNLGWVVEKAHCIWVHDHRNEQYHGGMKGTPEKQVLTIVRKAALWIFGLLFDVTDVDAALEEAIIHTLPPTPPKPDEKYNKVIDQVYGMIEVAGQIFYSSEILFGVDPDAYREIGSQLCDQPHSVEELNEINKHGRE
jgi:hypothetical protein